MKKLTLSKLKSAAKAKNLLVEVVEGIYLITPMKYRSNRMYTQDFSQLSDAFDYISRFDESTLAQLKATEQELLFLSALAQA